MNEQVNKFLSTLSDPDMVGAAEYRAIYDLLNSAVADDGEVELRHMDAILDEFINWSKALKAGVKKARWKGKG